jgi:hypothetical protein
MSDQEIQKENFETKVTPEVDKKKKGWFLPTVLAMFGFALFTYLFLGIFVVQPIGAVPDGRTVIYWRSGTDLPFITSPDGYLIDKSLDVTLMGRGLVAGRLAKELDGRIIVRLPYWKFLYLQSTGGKEFVK